MSKIKYICETTDKIIAKSGTRNPFEICRDLNIRVYYKDLGTSLKAYYFYQSRIKNIVINSRSGVFMRPVLCAHELGHAVLHGSCAAMQSFKELELFDTVGPAEYEANLFAAELIIPDDELFSLISDRDKSFFFIAKELCVPTELLDFKFRILKKKGYKLDSPCVSRSTFLKNDIPGCF